MVNFHHNKFITYVLSLNLSIYEPITITLNHYLTVTTYLIYIHLTSISNFSGDLKATPFLKQLADLGDNIHSFFSPC